MKKVLTIAGSDCSGGAGIQADIKTIIMHKMYAMSVITAMTAQNTTGVFSIVESSPKFVAAQLDTVLSDIFPDSIKIGMVSNKDIIKVIANKLQEYNVKNIVVDPVIVCKNRHKLISDDAIQSIIDCLFPIATIITPNLFEAEILSGVPIKNESDLVKSACEISKKFSGAILIKGGYLRDSADDLLYQNAKFQWFYEKKINNNNTHGTGCTLSSSLACNLANGFTIEESVHNSKLYLNNCISSMLDLGKGTGPIEHVQLQI